MNNGKLLELARQAGFLVGQFKANDAYFATAMPGCILDKLAKFAKLVAGEALAQPKHEGYVLVPKTPTNEMTSAMADALEDPENKRSSRDLAENMYQAMLAEASKVQQDQEPTLGSFRDMCSGQTETAEGVATQVKAGLAHDVAVVAGNVASVVGGVGNLNDLLEKTDA